MVATNDAAPSAPRSQLFMLRLWPEDLGGGQIDWRGKVQHMTSGEARYFRDWSTLEAFVEGLLHRIEAQASRADGHEEAEDAPR
jgi:hypothetical protein